MDGVFTIAHTSLSSFSSSGESLKTHHTTPSLLSPQTMTLDLFHWEFFTPPPQKNRMVNEKDREVKKSKNRSHEKRGCLSNQQKSDRQLHRNHRCCHYHFNQAGSKTFANREKQRDTFYIGRAEGRCRSHRALMSVQPEKTWASRKLRTDVWICGWARLWSLLHERNTEDETTTCVWGAGGTFLRSLPWRRTPRSQSFRWGVVTGFHWKVRIPYVFVHETLL